MESRRCVVTGASGLVGSAVSSRLSSQGWRVLGLNRSGGFVLGEDIGAQALRGAYGLVHCAYDFKARTWEEIGRTNVNGSIRLLKTAREAGIQRLVFLSSISAYEGCLSLYGKGKLLVEQSVLALGGYVIRPGLVFGGLSGRGMYGSLERMAALPVLPVFDGGAQPFFLVHAEDLARAVESALSAERPAGERILIAAHPESVPFAELLRAMASGRGRRLRCLSVPGGLSLGALRVLERLGLGLRFRSDSLVSLLNPNPNPDFSNQGIWNVSFRPYPLGSGLDIRH
ncbi:MAG: NAD(P)-dependent oxidoreductase [Elusimicrobia bacterium]|nr:NAD(P)-dependent oxidoreductase [Elusimicrobiota bacterium]